jgi:hypothetical protein
VEDWSLALTPVDASSMPANANSCSENFFIMF